MNSRRVFYPGTQRLDTAFYKTGDTFPPARPLWHTPPLETFGSENHRPHSGAPARSAETQRGQQVLGCARVTGWLADLEGSKLFEHRDFGRMGSKRSPV